MYLVFNPKSTNKNAYWDSFLSIIKNYPNDGLFLEIGAVDTEQVATHQKIFTRLIGLDLNFARLPRSAGIEMVNADAQFLPFKNNIFDGIVSHHVIEHVENDSLFICEIMRTLKKDSFAILGTPNRKRLVRVLAELFTGERIFPWREHKREYTKQELLKLANMIGLKNALVYNKFFGIHSYRIILGFSRYHRILDKWCNFLFFVLVK